MGLLDELTDNDLRQLAALVAPIVKSDAIQVGNLPVANTLEGISSIPCIQQTEGVLRTVRVSVNQLQGGVIAYPKLFLDPLTGRLKLSLPYNAKNKFKVNNGHLILIQEDGD